MYSHIIITYAIYWLSYILTLIELNRSCIAMVYYCCIIEILQYCNTIFLYNKKINAHHSLDST